VRPTTDGPAGESLPPPFGFARRHREERHRLRCCLYRVAGLIRPEFNK
jgi:hypothetical protein